MVGRILLELALFLAPFGVFFLYRAASRTMSIADRWPLTRLVIAGAVLAALALIITPLFAPPTGNRCYRPPRVVEGESVPGGYFDCEEVALPEPEVAKPPVVPVAPRDRLPDS